MARQIEVSNPSTQDPDQCLVWLVSHLSNKQKEVLRACFELADENGRFGAGGFQSVYQRIAHHSDRSPGYTNTGLNELVWLGLLRLERKQFFRGSSCGGANLEEYEVVGWPHNQSWYLRAVLGIERVSGRSSVVETDVWKQALEALKSR